MDRTASSVATALIEAGNIDTVYRDVYLDRARTVLGPVLSLEDFHRLEQERAVLAELPLTIARALNNANWSLVKQLSERAQTLKRAIDDKSDLLRPRGAYTTSETFCSTRSRPVSSRSRESPGASCPRSGNERWNCSRRSSGQTLRGTTSTVHGDAHSRNGRRRVPSWKPMRPRRRRTQWSRPDRL
jgi:hypothetical protein